MIADEEQGKLLRGSKPKSTDIRVLERSWSTKTAEETL